MQFISYLRVSSASQKVSGLGIEAQRASIKAYADRAGGTVIREYVEYESGKSSENRPELLKALAHAKRGKCTLIVSKLDRLSRNLKFLATFLESGVEFSCVDLPNANRLTLGIMATLAEHERTIISERTRAALQALKARGVALGSAREGHWKGREGIRIAALVKARAARLANLAKKESPYADLMPIIESMERDGKSLKEIAAALNASGHTTSRGAPFQPYSVGRVLGRY